ncbi:uncharacterized protein LOC111831048 [Capsella rubella]|uniref:uncharacterized protein LOC111831048 n=1 Tax=Capsella rubella TaxID=81985 RepID=UPI000CD4C953|nr:uncharacterized protein LOC111831048 [Capsella rubella]
MDDSEQTDLSTRSTGLLRMSTSSLHSTRQTASVNARGQSSNPSTGDAKKTNCRQSPRLRQAGQTGNQTPLQRSTRAVNISSTPEQRLPTVQEEPSSTTLHPCSAPAVVPELLPERVFATDRYPQNGRINSYSKKEYLLDIVDVLDGTQELKAIRESPFGPLLDYPVRRSSLSGKLVHNILCRSLHTDKQHEIWFVFGGQPIRFSLREFALITRLPCGPFPDQETILKSQTLCNTRESYWQKLFGKK